MPLSSEIIDGRVSHDRRAQQKDKDGSRHHPQSCMEKQAEKGCALPEANIKETTLYLEQYAGVALRFRR